MDSITKIFSDSDHAYLASIWLQQQDLSDKSPTEISDMYYKAYREICENYAPKPSRLPESHGLSKGNPFNR